ncbi:MAG: hypothetical protein ACK6A7_17410, partial [Planctomycetota bacterium]
QHLGSGNAKVRSDETSMKADRCNRSVAATTGVPADPDPAPSEISRAIPKTGPAKLPDRTNGKLLLPLLDSAPPNG